MSGFRRFEADTSLTVQDRLVALVGRNEAGKSSVLAALALLRNDDPIPRADRTRDSFAEPKIVARFSLDPADREALAGIRGSDSVRWAVVTKSSDGRRRVEVDVAPTRDRSSREAARRALDAIRGDPALDPAFSSDEAPWDNARFERVVELLALDAETLPEGALEEVPVLSASLNLLAYPAEPDLEEGAEQDRAETARRHHRADLRGTVIAELGNVLRGEASEHPATTAANRLLARLPDILLFSEADRSLHADYDLADYADDAFPPALANLAELAEFSLNDLRNNVVGGEKKEALTTTNRANKVLARKIGEAWGQSDIRCQLKTDGTRIEIYVEGEGSDTVFAVTDRSDGVRTFIALQAFVAGYREVKPILLIDEAETHLHYDAQVDLIDVLDTQRLATQVVYTTHSLGCVPLDVVSAIRAVVPDANAERSRIDNSVWTGENGLALTPLLFGMGATFLALVVPRFAVLTEGPSDSLLLPTLLRSHGDGEPLKFRVSPGLSNASSVTVRAVDNEAGKVAMMVDGDPGGQDVKEKLLNAEVDEARIVSLADLPGSPVTIEDFVASNVLAVAATDVVLRWRDVPTHLDPKDVPSIGKWKAIEGWCAQFGKPAPGKVELAQAVRDVAPDFEQLIDPAMSEALGELGTRLTNILGLS